MPARLPLPPRPSARPLTSFGWALAGVLGLALSMPPVGFYPLAWIGLVPLLARWSQYTSWRECAREVYALFLVLSTASGFWALLEPSTSLAVLGLGLLIAVPMPLVVAFCLAHVVRRRFGLAAGLLVLGLDLLALEFLALSSDAGLPWLLLGHTQVEALPFIQTADLGGVLLLSAWVLLLNVVGFAALPVRRPSAEGVPAFDVSRSGLGVALMAVLVAVPSVYGVVSSHRTGPPTGYARLGIVQPGLSAASWEAHGGSSRVDHLASLSDRLIQRWVAESSPSADSLGELPAGSVASPGRWAGLRHAASPASGGLIVWPRDALPSVGTAARQRVLEERLGEWCQQRGVSLLTGAQVASDEPAAPRPGAIFFSPERRPARRTALARAAVSTASEPPLFSNGGVRVAALVGGEARSGALARALADDGASLFVVLARNGTSGGQGAHDRDLALTRLRAVETRRSVVVASASGATALVTASGQTDRLAGWMEQGLIPLDVPTYGSATLYTRHGDWLGRWALGLGLAVHLAFGLFGHVRPAPNRLREQARTFRGGVPVLR